MSAKKILSEVQGILDDREVEYDDYTDMLQTIADYWNVYLKDMLHHKDLGIDIFLDPSSVAQMMALFKVARASVGWGDKTADDMRDAIGYLAMSADLEHKDQIAFDSDEDDLTDEDDKSNLRAVREIQFITSPDWETTEDSFENLVRSFTDDEGHFVAGWKVREDD